MNRRVEEGLATDSLTLDYIAAGKRRRRVRRAGDGVRSEFCGRHVGVTSAPLASPIATAPASCLLAVRPTRCDATGQQPNVKRTSATYNHPAEGPPGSPEPRRAPISLFASLLSLFPPLLFSSTSLLFSTSPLRSLQPRPTSSRGIRVAINLP